MPNQIAANPDDEMWEFLPDHNLLEVFYYLKAGALLQAAQVCSQWRRVARDEFLWKELLCHRWKIDRNLPLAPARNSWFEEYKRLHYHTPCHETETLTNHKDQVLHISFSHNGKHFATSSKDGFVKVWSTDYPCSLVYSEDMKVFHWKYTQFTQFNRSDKLLLVSGVHFGSHSTSGEIAIFNMEDGFKLESRVQNKPYDIFGTWYNETHLFSGNLHWLGNFTSCSVLWLNKAYQELDSEWENVVMRLFKFQNINASSIRTILVADCLDAGGGKPGQMQTVPRMESVCLDEGRGKSGQGGMLAQGEFECLNPGELGQSGHEESVVGEDSLQSQSAENIALSERESGVGCGDSSVSFVGQEKKLKIECRTYTAEKSNLESLELDLTDGTNVDLPYGTKLYSRLDGVVHGNSGVCRGDVTVNKSNAEELPPLSSQASSQGFSSASQSSGTNGENMHREPDKYLIFTTGSLTYTPHQIGIKRVRHEDTIGKMQKLVEERKRQQAAQSRRRQRSGGDPGDEEVGLEEQHSNGHVLLDMDHVPDEADAMRMDSIDHLIEMSGHIIGFCLSQDNRYLYVNTRAWPTNYQITDPLEPPPIAQEIEIHVIDLLTIEDLGVMHSAHKAFTPNDECFFIFLDVCREYVASGAEDKHAYLWDRHYRSLIHCYTHEDVVNSVAFHSRDSETLVTVSDDHKIKVWRSRNQCRENGINTLGEGQSKEDDTSGTKQESGEA